MFPLDEPTIQILIRLIDRMANQEGLDLSLRDHPLLRVQRLEDIQTDEGPGYLLAIGQLSSVNPPKYETRLTLLVIDARDSQTWQGPLTAFPVALHDDMNDVSEVGALVSKGKIRKFNALIQQSLAGLARSWLAELATAGYF